MTSKLRTRQQLCRWSYVLVAAGLIVVVLVMTIPKKGMGLQASELTATDPPLLEKVNEGAPGAITEGEEKGISYYHCSGIGKGDEMALIMLHGAKFTKKDWKSPSGIMQDLCTRETKRKLSVFAMDLPFSATFKDLTVILDSMAGLGKISTPVALVTPSASGKIMDTWADSAAVEDTLPKYIAKWIPVAPVAFRSTPEHNIKNLSELPTLAIYGNEDSLGKHVSERLKTFANAHVVELEGGHPCYLDKPKEFVDEVVNFLDQP